MTNYPVPERNYDHGGAAPPGYPDQTPATAYPGAETPEPAAKQKKPRRWVSMILVGAIAFVVGVAAGGAGGNDDATDSAASAGRSEDSEAITELESERDQLQGELESVTADLESLTAERDELSGDLETMTEERDAALTDAEEAEVREADAAAEAAEEEAQAASTSFADGSWRVGEDIDPGTYRAEGSDACYWERLSGFSGELGEIISNDFSSGPTTVTIAEDDAGFTSQRCGTWELQE